MSPHGSIGAANEQQLIFFLKFPPLRFQLSQNIRSRNCPSVRVVFSPVRRFTLVPSLRACSGCSTRAPSSSRASYVGGSTTPSSSNGSSQRRRVRPGSRPCRPSPIRWCSIWLPRSWCIRRRTMAASTQADTMGSSRCSCRTLTPLGEAGHPSVRHVSWVPILPCPTTIKCWP